VVTSPGALGQIVAVVMVYGAVCVVFGAVFGMALGPLLARWCQCGVHQRPPVRSPGTSPGADAAATAPGEGVVSALALFRRR
jgi:hypothetical protein